MFGFTTKQGDFKLNYLRKYWLKYRVPFMFAVFCVLMEAVCELFQPRVVSLLIDNGAMRGSLPDVFRYGLIMLGVTLCALCFALSRNFLSARVSQRFAADLRLDMFVKIQSLSSYGIDSFEGGSLITRETNDVTQLQNFVNGLMRVIAKAPILCIGSIIMSATLNIRAMPVIVPVIALVTVVITITMKLAYPRFRRVQDSLDRFNTSVREYLAGIRLVKAFRRLKDEEERFDNRNRELTDATVEANRTLAVFSPFTTFFAHLGVAAILWFGSRWVDYGEMQVGQIIAFVSYMMSILSSLNHITNMLNIFVRVRASHHRIAEVFNTEPGSELRIDAPSAEYELDHDAPHLELRNVGFRYRGSTGHPALTDVSFSLRKGETLGIIGPTGSGKSTLAALLMRFYEPTDGEIFVGGAPLAERSESEWRTRAAIVPQLPLLFTGTIRDNIAWGKPEAPDREIENAARDAQAYEFIISSQDGFGRQIGQSGAGLSGGQKQRVSIARALVRQPELLVLDDCTSALDVITEAAVKDSLAEHDMTTLLITQRVATVRGCDKILVLENGEMAGFGTHEELSESCEVYRDIYMSQIGVQSEIGDQSQTEEPSQIEAPSRVGNMPNAFTLSEIGGESDG